jgi:hypothetical protein
MATKRLTSLVLASGHKMEVHIATEGREFKRLINVIDSKTYEDGISRIKGALDKNKLLSLDQMSLASKAVTQYVDVGMNGTSTISC